MEVFSPFFGGRIKPTGFSWGGRREEGGGEVSIPVLAHTWTSASTYTVVCGSQMLIKARHAGFCGKTFGINPINNHVACWKFHNNNIIMLVLVEVDCYRPLPFIIESAVSGER
jgi:hypothetical protein